MLKLFIQVFFLFFVTVAVAAAADNSRQDGGEAKEISGMSIVGNNEAPTSLVIVPWKSSEIGQETKLNSNLLDDRLNPVDRAVFMRTGFYQLGNLIRRNFINQT
jgi:hypothetical protein